MQATRPRRIPAHERVHTAPGAGRAGHHRECLAGSAKSPKHRREGGPRGASESAWSRARGRQAGVAHRPLCQRAVARRDVGRLLRPLGTLSLVGVASGAFATLLHRDGAALPTIPMEMAARYSSEQILELAIFVHEVNPGALEQLTALLTVGATGAVALSASALVLLSRRLGSTPAPTPCARSRRAELRLSRQQACATMRACEAILRVPRTSAPPSKPYAMSGSSGQAV